jgi:hypothetical protein
MRKGLLRRIPLFEVTEVRRSLHDVKLHNFCRIRGSHIGDYEEFYLPLNANRRFGGT